jgi:uncharacterized membrane protein
MPPQSDREDEHVVVICLDVVDDVLMFWPFGFLIIYVVMMMLMIRHGGNGRRREDPLDILRERFARDDIDRQEFEDRKGPLSQP